MKTSSYISLTDACGKRPRPCLPVGRGFSPFTPPRGEPSPSPSPNWEISRGESEIDASLPSLGCVVLASIQHGVPTSVKFTNWSWLLFLVAHGPAYNTRDGGPRKWGPCAVGPDALGHVRAWFLVNFTGWYVPILGVSQDSLNIRCKIRGPSIIACLSNLLQVITIGQDS
jgi:hypothetical protein